MHLGFTDVARSFCVRVDSQAEDFWVEDGRALAPPLSTPSTTTGSPILAALKRLKVPEEAYGRWLTTAAPTDAGDDAEDGGFSNYW